MEALEQTQSYSVRHAVLYLLCQLDHLEIPGTKTLVRVDSPVGCVGSLAESVTGT